MAYAPITRVDLTNFMSIKRGSVDFDHSGGIVRLVGLNDSGKSAVQRALVVALLNLYPASQKKFITDGTQFFQVDVSFADGFMLRYEKHDSGTSLYELYDNGDLVYTNKLREGIYEKITKVPDVIEQYLGLVATPDGVSLNYGVNTDKQLLAETTGSENYATISTVLKSEELSRAVALLNKKNNSLRSELQQTENTLQSYKMQYNQFIAIDDELCAVVSGLADEVEKSERVKDSLDKTLEIVESLNGIELIPEVDSVPGESVIRIFDDTQGAIKSLNTLENIPLVESLPAQGIVLGFNQVMETIASLDKMVVFPELESIQLGAPDCANEAMSIMSSLADLFEEAGSLQADHDNLMRQYNDELAYLESEGKSVTRCPNCGELHFVA